MAAAPEYDGLTLTTKEAELQRWVSGTDPAQREPPATEDRAVYEGPPPRDEAVVWERARRLEAVRQAEEFRPLQGADPRLQAYAYSRAPAAEDA